MGIGGREGWRRGRVGIGGWKGGECGGASKEGRGECMRSVTSYALTTDIAELVKECIQFGEWKLFLCYKGQERVELCKVVLNGSSR